MSIKTALRQFLWEEELDPFALWAFGDDYESYSKATQFAYAWNRLHKDLHHIDMSNSIAQDLEIMTDLWKNDFD